MAGPSCRRGLAMVLTQGTVRRITKDVSDNETEPLITLVRADITRGQTQIHFDTVMAEEE